MPFEAIDILTLIPQRPPFVAVDTLLYCDKEVTRTAFQVAEKSLFLQGDRLSEAGMVENMAQSCAVRMGYINTYLSHDSIKLGFIASILNMRIHRLPRVGDRIETEILVLQEVFHITKVRATIRLRGEVVAEGEMKIAISDIEKR